MTVVDTIRSSRSDWLNKRPWLFLIVSYILTLIIGLAIGQGFRNVDTFGKIAGSYHYLATHQVSPGMPSHQAPNKRD